MTASPRLPTAVTARDTYSVGCAGEGPLFPSPSWLPTNDEPCILPPSLSTLPLESPRHPKPSPRWEPSLFHSSMLHCTLPAPPTLATPLQLFQEHGFRGIWKRQVRDGQTPGPTSPPPPFPPSCAPGRLGRLCECSEAELSSPDLESGCRAPNGTGPLCSGKGRCQCGRCSCSGQSSGRLCECDDASCERHEGILCGGTWRLWEGGRV